MPRPKNPNKPVKPTRGNGELRSKDATNQTEFNPAGKGGSVDSGIGSKAVNALLDYGTDDDAINALKKTYDAVLKLVGKLDTKIQRAVLLSAVSEFQFDSLVERAKESAAKGTGPRVLKLGAREEATIEAIRKLMGDKEADRMRENMLKAKPVVRASKAETSAKGD